MRLRGEKSSFCYCSLCRICWESFNGGSTSCIWFLNVLHHVSGSRTCDLCCEFTLEVLLMRASTVRMSVKRGRPPSSFRYGTGVA